MFCHYTVGVLPLQFHSLFLSSRGLVYDALAGDYDGDSKLDLFVIYKNNLEQRMYNGGFLWGDRDKFSKDELEIEYRISIVILGDLQPVNYFFQTIPTTLE